MNDLVIEQKIRNMFYYETQFVLTSTKDHYALGYKVVSVHYNQDMTIGLCIEYTKAPEQTHCLDYSSKAAITHIIDFINEGYTLTIK